MVKCTAEGLMFEDFDLPNAYLFGKITGGLKIILTQPKNSTGIPVMPGYLCQLHKSIDGLCQVGEISGSVIHNKFITFGFRQSTKYPRLYFYKKGNSFINLIIVVDDMAFSWNDRQLVTCFKNLISSKFKVKLLGEIRLWIGWELQRSQNGLLIGRKAYTQRLLKEHNMEHSKPVKTPLPFKFDISSTIKTEVDFTYTEHKYFRSLIRHYIKFSRSIICCTFNLW